MNTVVVSGNVATAPELTFHGSGQRCRLRFRLGDRRSYTDATGAWRDETSFHNIVAWGTLASNAAESLTVGDLIMVVGHMMVSDYIGRDSEKSTWHEIVATNMGPSLLFATAVPIRNLKSQKDSDATTDRR